MRKTNMVTKRKLCYMKVKNVADRILGGIGLIVLSPVYLAIIIASRMSSKGQKIRITLRNTSGVLIFCIFLRLFVPIMAIGKYLNIHKNMV